MNYLHCHVIVSKLEMELLWKYTFIALDNFRTILQNRDIRNKLEAQLQMEEMKQRIRELENAAR